ncbi:MAG: 50S ribosomal protein L11 methyltransferase [Pseudomonadales bacterium]
MRLTFELDRGSVEAAEALLEPFGPLSLTVTDAGDEPVLEPAPGEAPLWAHCRLEALFDLDLDVAGLRAALGRAGRADIGLDFLDDADWQNRWRQYAVDFCFADRLWLVPRDVAAPGEPALHLDPGLAFGSGSHPTTRLCLDRLARADLSGTSVLDYGCGSGILALAALKLGADRVLAIDHDPQALLATQENAAYNALGDGKTGGRLEVGLPALLTDKRFDVVVANILANPLIELAAMLTEALEPDGVLILSGLLAAQADAVMAAYPALAFLPVVCEADEQGRRWARLEGRRKDNLHGR